MFEDVHSYLEKVTPHRTPVLKEMEEYAKENDFPIIGPLVGRLLYQLAELTNARRILELGSGYGYSAFWFSMSAGARGHITMTDTNKSNKKMAMDFFKRAGLRSQFDFMVGDSLKSIKKLTGPYDIILNDIDKQDYPKTIDLAAPRLKKGGLFITDNLIWGGDVYTRNSDASTKGIREFTDKLYKDNRFFTTIVPLRDGVAIALKL
ncbi:MAG TPA: O-methyltransferase [candidate division Zixibacteria bacterium]|nr:O-methyltransferase [candidate division Zixibacteria bacterium]